MAAGQALHHVGRRQHHEADVFIGVDAARRHPEPQLVVMGRERKRHCEGQRFRAAFAALCDHARQRQRRCHRIKAIAVDLRQQGGMQCRRDRDRVAVEAKVERCRNRNLNVPKPKAGGDRDRRQQMRGVKQSDVEFVADIGPRHLPHQRDVQSLGCGKTFINGHDQSCRVDQRNEPYANRCAHFNNCDAVRMDCAISAIFFFSRIAVERSKT